MKSPIVARSKQRIPNFVLLIKPLIIKEEYLEIHPKWETILNWYKETEEDPNTLWVDKALQTMINAVVYQQRIYFAVTRDTLKSLFEQDLNWKERISLSPRYYPLLLREMIESGIFEAHSENEKLKAKRKPMVFKVVHPDIISLINPTPEDVQEKQVLEFVDNYDENEVVNEVVNNVVNNVVNTEREKVRKLEREEFPLNDKENQGVDTKITFSQYLLRHWQEWPRYEELEDLVKYAIANCNDFNNPSYVAKKFRKHLESAAGKVTPARKKLISGLENKLRQCAEMYLELAEANSVRTELQAPDENMFSSTRLTIKEESSIQNNTIRILNAAFGKENIQLLKRKLSSAEDDSDKIIIQQEIDFWESVIYEGR